MSEATRWILLWAVTYVAVAAMVVGFALECSKPSLTGLDLVIAILAGLFWPVTMLMALGARIAKDA